ncbi:hypothetical protein R1sor_027045 [Riccia sorocarpa]|uniref:NECAP PHear domain-containing protein n=1 Tax=Riccia sorocarpa TaxID=122646 RepID=A0ABD3GEU4_9MARC
MSYEDDDSVEHTLLVVREVSVYKIPPRSTSGGYKCGEWLQSDKIWTGRLKVLSLKEKCEVRLEDSNTGELFAACPVLPGKRDATVENVTDSSRYFVLRIEDGRGKHAFIGLGFAERNEAFDFNVALSDHEKYAKRELEKGEEAQNTDSQNASAPLDLRLKEGETIRINVKTLKQPPSGSGMLSGGSSNPTQVPKAMKGALAPPPGGGRLRSPLPPPPNDTRPIRSPHQAYVTTTSVKSYAQDKKPDRQSAAAKDSFSDMSSLKANLPSSTRASSGSTSSSWAAF